MVSINKFCNYYVGLQSFVIDACKTCGLEHNSIYLQRQLDAAPFQLADNPNLVQVLVVDPPVFTYPLKQEYVQREPTSVEFVQDTLPLDGAGGVDVQRIPFKEEKLKDCDKLIL